MPTTLEWRDVALRLLLTIVAGILFGLNRSGRGRPAGLVTTVLVCLAASISMIQTNLLLGTAGKSADSFVSIDLMRLPLGILTGMGFIGGGAILRRGEMIRGVTTAATLWMVTIIGLCFGGGQLALGLTALALGLLALGGLKKLESLLGQDRQATLLLRITEEGPAESEVRGQLSAAGYRIRSFGVTHHAAGAAWRSLRYEVEWHGGRTDATPPAFLDPLARRPGVMMLRWKM